MPCARNHGHAADDNAEAAADGRRAARVDVVVVAYRSSRNLRRCVAALAGVPWIRVIVVDNDSPDDEFASVAGLDVEFVRSGSNAGFAFGCNVGAAAGSAPFILLLNPDATVDPEAVAVLAHRLECEQSLALVGPRIVNSRGVLEPSQRRFPSLRSTFAQALFLHRVFPRAEWTDELIRDAVLYERRTSPDWLSGACMLIRREALARIGGLDEGFFLYSEDTDLCRRLRSAGYGIAFEPTAMMTHIGGGSAPRSSMAARLALSRVRYAHKHSSRLEALLHTVGIALGEFTHTIGSALSLSVARGHAAALRSVLSDSMARLRGTTSPTSIVALPTQSSDRRYVRSQEG
jgi:N-acetylglucosaminyl-diphospho-decaprenol L-rhamnosyltransferase